MLRPDFTFNWQIVINELGCYFPISPTEATNWMCLRRKVLDAPIAAETPLQNLASTLYKLPCHLSACMATKGNVTSEKKRQMNSKIFNNLYSCL